MHMMAWSIKNPFFFNWFSLEMYSEQNHGSVSAHDFIAIHSVETFNQEPLM